MDIEKLIERLQNAAGGPEGIKMCNDAATALSTLQAENEKLREELEQKSKLIAQQAAELERRDTLLKDQEAELDRMKRERDAAVNAIRTWRFCESCKFGGTPMNYDCLGCYRASKWVWNGQKEG